MKNLIIFCLHAGGGHIAAAQAIKECLQNNYQVTTVNFFNDVISWIDPISLSTFGRFHLTDCYNFLIARGCNHWANRLSWLSANVYPFFNFFVHKLVVRTIVCHKPDLVISVTPLVNGAIARAAEQCNIPFIIVPTDLDTRWFTRFLNPNLPFTFLAPFNEPMIIQKILDAGIKKDQLIIAGFPIRRSFLEDLDSQDAIREEFGILPKKKVVLLMMGAIGSSIIISYCKEIIKMDLPVHLLVCVGKNHALGRVIKDLLLPEHIAMSVLSFTDRIAELVRVADVLITKSGSVSVCEALYTGLPILLDGTAMPLAWEKLNRDFVQIHGFGQVIEQLSDTASVLGAYLQDEKNNVVRAVIDRFTKPHFGENLRKLVESI